MQEREGECGWKCGSEWGKDNPKKLDYTGILVVDYLAVQAYTVATKTSLRNLKRLRRQRVGRISKIPTGKMEDEIKDFENSILQGGLPQWKDVRHHGDVNWSSDRDHVMARPPLRGANIRNTTSLTRLTPQAPTCYSAATPQVPQYSAAEPQAEISHVTCSSKRKHTFELAAATVRNNIQKDRNVSRSSKLDDEMVVPPRGGA